MKTYKIYFEIFNKKLVTEYLANNYEEAKRQFLLELPNNVKFYDNVKSSPKSDYNPFQGDVFNNLKNMMGI